MSETIKLGKLKEVDSTDEEASCYIERFVAGRMSSGVVGTQFIKELDNSNHCAYFFKTS